MAVSLLVVTPSSSFGETIRAALEQTESYRVFVVSNKVPAIVRAEEESCQMAFLDLDLGQQWVEDIGKALRTVMPNMKLFILAGDDTPPAFDSIRPWTLIRKPFQLPEVLSTLARPSDPPPPTKPATSPLGPLPWLSDADAAARHLTRLTLESSSQAALIARNNKVWAYAGELSRQAAEEVAAVMIRNWDSETDGDLLRFTRLDATRAEHILYATRIGRGVLLGLVFDAETPFGTIRAQAGKLASLIERESEDEEQVVVSTAPLRWSTVLPHAPAKTEAPAEAEEEIPVPPIAEILKDIPRPDPEPAAPAAQRVERSEMAPTPVEPSEPEPPPAPAEASEPEPPEAAPAPVEASVSDSSHQSPKLPRWRPARRSRVRRRLPLSWRACPRSRRHLRCP